MTVHCFICKGSGQVMCDREVAEIEIMSMDIVMTIMRRKIIKGCIKYCILFLGSGRLLWREKVRDNVTKSQDAQIL